MPTLAQVYEEHAEECLHAAAKTDDPKYRDMLLKLASAWREDAEELTRRERRVMQHLRLWVIGRSN
jgi:hypothetical protein